MKNFKEAAVVFLKGAYRHPYRAFAVLGPVVARITVLSHYIILLFSHSIRELCFHSSPIVADPDSACDHEKKASTRAPRSSYAPLSFFFGVMSSSRLPGFLFLSLACLLLLSSVPIVNAQGSCLLGVVGAICDPALTPCEEPGRCVGLLGLVGLVCSGKTVKSAGTVCATSQGPCDSDAVCDGSTNVCPATPKKPSTTICSASRGPCEANAYCTGNSPYCTTRLLLGPTTKCGNSLGPCDRDHFCSGTSISCPATNYTSSGTVCNAATPGTCEQSATCSGSSATCPAKTVKAAGVVCNAASGGCQNNAVCDGSSSTCPTRTLKPNATLCSAAGGSCALDSFCDGSNPACPAKVFLPSTTICDPSTGPCQGNTFCTGSSAVCPPKIYNASGTICDPSSGPCETNGTCSGSSSTCSSKSFLPSSTVCDASRGGCETNAFCSGGSASCPSKSILASGTVCNAAGGDCQLDAQCDGSSFSCPDRVFKNSSVICHASQGPCERNVLCTGSDAECAPRDFIPSGTVCSSATASCQADSTCSGNNATCPPLAPKPLGTVCNARDGPCQLDAVCDGTNTDCPNRPILPANSLCNASRGSCETSAYCDGSSATCPPKSLLPAGTGCFPGSSCLNQAFCNGSSTNCPIPTSKTTSTKCYTSKDPNCLADTFCSGSFDLFTLRPYLNRPIINNFNPMNDSQLKNAGEVYGGCPDPGWIRNPNCTCLQGPPTSADTDLDVVCDNGTWIVRGDVNGSLTIPGGSVVVIQGSIHIWANSNFTLGQGSSVVIKGCSEVFGKVVANASTATPTYGSKNVTTTVSFESPECSVIDPSEVVIPGISVTPTSGVKTPAFASRDGCTTSTETTTQIDPGRGLLALVATPTTTCSRSSSKLPRWFPYAVAFGSIALIVIIVILAVIFSQTLRRKLTPSWVKTRSTAQARNAAGNAMANDQGKPLVTNGLPAPLSSHPGSAASSANGSAASSPSDASPYTSGTDNDQTPLTQTHRVLHSNNTVEMTSINRGKFDAQ